ncbi:MAG: MobP3 family relaxase [Hydrogenoanaerobacterium sp.]
MSSPKLICKSGYIKDLAHVLNTLEYAGNKIAAQHIVFKDGTVLEVDPEARIALTKAEQEAVSGIRLSYKDGGGKDISYESYSLFTKEKTEAVRVHDLQTVQNDETWLVNSDGKSYHNIEDLDFFKYLPYVAERPGVEKEDGHGLFGLTGNIDIEQAKALATEYENSIKWSHIISLDAQAAADAGFDCRSAWKDLIIAKSPQIAKAYHISLENLVINCAYHGNTDNPHAHLIFYSKSSSEGYIKGGKPQMQVASEALKSMFYNDIFKNDVREIEIEKSKNRDTIKQSLNKYLQNCMAKDYGQTELADMLLDIANEIKGLGGTKKYGYMSPKVKTKVDNLFRRVVEHDNDMAAMFEKICGIHRKQIDGYVSNPAVIDEKMKMFRQEFFSPKKDKLRIYHNTILDFAVKINSMALPAAVRTAEEKIFNNKPQMLELSSEIFAPADEPEEILEPIPSRAELSSENYYRQAIRQNRDVFFAVSKNLNIGHIKFVCKELKPELKEFRSQLYRRLCGALTGGNPAASALMCQYKASPSAEKMDELLKALSDKDYDFTAEKEKLYQSVFAKLREHGISQPESEYRSGIDKLFYGGGDNPYDTLHMHETIVNVLENSSEIIHKHNVYICTHLTKLLFQSLARLLHGQAENANRYSKDEHSFAAKPQFRNRKQFAERGTLHDNSISY